MIPYYSISGKASGVTAYEIGEGYIKVQFQGTRIYTYPTSLNSENVIRHMQSLALASEGLSTFIAQNKQTLRFY